jgi:hypothetical protein
MNLFAATDSGFAIGYTIGIVVVLVVVALVVPILVLAKKIGDDAVGINDGLTAAATNTASLKELTTTIDSAERITAGLERGRKRLGG